MKKQLIKITEDQLYKSDDGYVMSREYGEKPNGCLIGGNWVLRGPTGEYLDSDQYRHDLIERHNLTIK